MQGRLSVLPLLPLVVAIGLVASGCGPPDDPRAVADAFWKAALAGRYDEAVTVSTAVGPEQVEALMAGHRPERVVTDEALRSRDRALVPTRWILPAPAPAEGAPPPPPAPPVAFHTVVVRFEHGWRVELSDTRSELRSALIAASLDQLDDAMHRGGEALGRALEEGARQAADAMERAAEALRQSLPSSEPENEPEAP